MNQAIKVAAKSQPATHALIILHGLGDTGNGWTFLAQELQSHSCFQNTNFIFPNAPNIPITANGGMTMTGWFDIKEWDPQLRKFDTEGFLKSVKGVKEYINEQVDLGIPRENIIVGGFSQGAALSLGCAMDFPWKVGGFFVLSGFIDAGVKDIVWKDKAMYEEKKCNLDTPIFHGHGDSDPLVSISKGRAAAKFYSEECGFSDYSFHSYAGLDHSVGPQEMKDLIDFIKRCWKM